MLSRSAVRTITLMTCLVLAVAPAHAQQKKKSTGTKKKTASATTTPPDTVTYNGVKDLATLKDGAYEANGWYRKYNYRSVAFTKRGSSVAGFTADSGGVYCIQGTFEGNIITITDAANWDDEYDNGRQTGRYGFSPIRDMQEADFVSIRMVEEISTFPRRRIGWMTTEPYIIARDEKWMAGCLKYFSEPRAPGVGPPPCDDEDLRPTMVAPGTKPTYDFAPAPICAVADSEDCTVENVFALMLRMPAAIAPVKDPEEHTQAVENCGVLELQSITNTLKPSEYEQSADNNFIKIEIDEEHHRVINYTMPNHVFFPGQVIRQVVAFDGKVGVRTIGYGNEHWFTKYVVNFPAALFAWTVADGFLTHAFREIYLADEEPDEEGKAPPER